MLRKREGEESVEKVEAQPSPLPKTRFGDEPTTNDNYAIKLHDSACGNLYKTFSFMGATRDIIQLDSFFPAHRTAFAI